jgi:hypothetical protein
MASGRKQKPGINDPGNKRAPIPSVYSGFIIKKWRKGEGWMTGIYNPGD